MRCTFADCPASANDPLKPFFLNSPEPVNPKLIWWNYASLISIKSFSSQILSHWHSLKKTKLNSILQLLSSKTKSNNEECSNPLNLDYEGLNSLLEHKWLLNPNPGNEEKSTISFSPNQSQFTIREHTKFQQLVNQQQIKQGKEETKREIRRAPYPKIEPMTAPPAASPANRKRQTAGAGTVANAFEESLSVESSPSELRFEFESISTAFEESLAAIANSWSLKI